MVCADHLQSLICRNPAETHDKLQNRLSGWHFEEVSSPLWGHVVKPNHHPRGFGPSSDPEPDLVFFFVFVTQTLNWEEQLHEGDEKTFSILWSRFYSNRNPKTWQKEFSAEHFQVSLSEVLPHIYCRPQRMSWIMLLTTMILSDTPGPFHLLHSRFL